MDAEQEIVLNCPVLLMATTDHLVCIYAQIREQGRGRIYTKDATPYVPRGEWHRGLAAS